MTQLIRRIHHPGILVLEVTAPPANACSCELMKQLDPTLARRAPVA